MRVAHVCETPLAFLPWTNAAAMREIGLDARCVAPSGYSDGRKGPPADWPYPTPFDPQPEAVEFVRTADVIVAYQGRPYAASWYPRHRPTVFHYASQDERQHLDRRGEADGWPATVLGEYHPRLPYFAALPIVPELIPFANPLFQPAAKPDRVRLAYSPSNSTLGGWDDKGYAGTVAALEQCRAAGADVDIIMGTPWPECMARKAAAHVVIDECMTGGFHGNSVQGLALGCVVVNGADDHAEWVVRHVTGGCGMPFATCRMAGLVDKLLSLVALGPARLAERGRANRLWLEAAWGTPELWERCWLPVIRRAMERAKTTV